MTPEEAYAELATVAGIELHRELESTQALVGSGLTVVAVQQTAGRGRQARPWHSPPGGLWFSTSLSVSDLTAATLRVALACARLLSELGVDSRLRWPNDVLVDGKKICGALVDARAGQAIVGVGLNVAVDFPPELAELATSLHLYVPQRPHLGTLLERLLSHIRGALGESWADQRAETEARCLPAGTPVVLWNAGVPLRSELSGLGPDGSLLLADGSRHYSVERLELA